MNATEIFNRLLRDRTEDFGSMYIARESWNGQYALHLERSEFTHELVIYHYRNDGYGNFEMTGVYTPEIEDMTSADWFIINAHIYE